MVANSKQLTEQERAFAENWHGLIFAFLHYYKLDEDECYDVLALGYLRAVMRYNREKKLQKHSFSTIAWQAMRSSLGNKRKADRIRDRLIACSLNEMTDEGTEFIEMVQDPADSFAELEQQEEMEQLLKEVMPALSDRQREHLTDRLEGYKPQDIMKRQRKSVQAFHEDQKEIKSVIVSIVEDRACGGGVFEIWKFLKSLTG